MSLPPELAERTLEHLWLVFVAVSVGAAIAIPTGVLLARRDSLRRAAEGLASLFQTIPSLALFGFLLPIPLIGGVGKSSAIVALTLYALLPILRNTLLGMAGVNRSVRESAIAMGMTPRQLLRQVDIPLAMPSIVAGLRIATVATIGAATVAAAIGGGGLGTYIFRGIAMVDTGTVLAGAIPAAAMAVIADEVFAWFERRFAVAY